MTLNRNLLSEAVRYSLTAGSVGLLSLASAPAFAQDTTTAAAPETKTLGKVEVTGTRIKRAEAEGALPVTVITRKDIEISGKTTVADLLQDSTFNSFGANRPASGSSAQSMSAVSLRGLGSGRTLVLIDGRRAPLSPQFSEAGSDLNSIPLAAVERVEILSDGASAIYGADAIGGVINVITRKNFNGAEATIGLGDGKWGGDTEEGSFLMGTSNDRGRIIGGVSYATRQITWTRDDPWMAGIRGPSSFANNYYTVVTNPVTGETTYGKFISAVPGPEACSQPGFYMSGPVCRYDYNLVKADTAGIKQKGLFLKSDYQINDDWSVYLNANVTEVKGFSRFAPALADHGILVHNTSPNSPNYDPTATTFDPTQDVVLKHRFASLGPRDNPDTTTTSDANLGFTWQINEKASLDFGIRRAQSLYANFGYNYLNVPIATDLINSGEYDIYDPLGNPIDVLNKMNVTTSRDSHFDEDELYANGSFDLFDLAGGTSSLAVGIEHHKESFADIYDAQSAAGNVGGSSGNSSFGTRKFNSIYGEWLLPFTNAWEGDIAVRHDSFSDFGSSTVPKLSVRWHPLDNLTLRASYGKGFRAPPLVILNQVPSFSADSVNDPATAQAQGLPASASIQIDGLRVATADLKPEKSKQWSAGVVWDPTDWLSMKLDWYDINITDQQKFFDAQTVVNRTIQGQFLPSNLYVIRGPAQPPTGTNPNGLGAIVQVAAGWGNEGFVKTSGLDFNATTKFDLGDWGTLKNNLQYSWIQKYDIGGGPTGAVTHLIGTSDAPKWRMTLTNQWEKGDFSLVWTLNAFQQTPSYSETLLATYGYTCQQTVDYGYITAGSCNDKYFLTQDLSGSWKTPWNGKFTIGAINLTNEKPRIDKANFQPPYYNGNLYSGVGRQIYFRYTQSW